MFKTCFKRFIGIVLGHIIVIIKWWLVNGVWIGVIFVCACLRVA